MPRKYLQHFKLLAESIFLLLKTNVTEADIDAANSLLLQLFVNAGSLYRKSFMTLNMHQMMHLQQCVVKMGSLWAHSCFPFESANGKLLKLISAAKGVPLQIVARYSLEQKERHLLHSQYVRASTETLCKKIAPKADRDICSGDVSSRVLLSSPCVYSYTTVEMEALTLINFNIN